MTPGLGELLVRGGLITREQLNHAASFYSREGGAFISHLTKLRLISEESLVSFLAQQLSVQRVNLAQITAPKSLVDLLPPPFKSRHLRVPLRLVGSTLHLAMADPSDIVAVNEVKFLTGYNVKVEVAPESLVRVAIERSLDQTMSYDEILDRLRSEEIQVLRNEPEVKVEELEKASSDAPVVLLVNAVFADAIKKRASDIHVEPYEKIFRIRFRIDGVLHEIMNPPIRLKAALASRIKVMAGLDIAERRLSQDGRIKLRLGPGREMEVRVSVLPTLFGEKIVLRLLDKSNLQLDMTLLGFEEKALVEFKDAISRPNGMVLVTGPTGSGKSTTLYSALTELNQPEVNISTAEDPVEYNLPGINQVQIHEAIGVTFASCLRSFLRQDPDVIMVGEIRDLETAEISVKAALTGHLVLSTVHTNDAPSTVERLVNMGIERFLLTSSTSLILAQRLVRKVCTQCKEETKVSREILKDVGAPEEHWDGFQAYHGRGCESCNNTGYKGRIAIYEVMTLSDELKRLVLSGADGLKIKAAAMRQGMRTLRLSALRKVQEGMTTIEETVRVTPADHEEVNR
jgi:type IV pilus assembly protein PilB